jgi:uncharacterized protein (TIGR02391 family)
MATIKQLIPDAITLVDMHPTELGAYMLEALMPDVGGGNWNRRNFCIYVAELYKNDSGVSKLDMGKAISTAWSWLEANGLICKNPEQDGEWYVPTKRGKELTSRQGLRDIVSNQELPEEFLHPDLLINARPLFLQSRFETSVFEAFKALEIAIRTKAKLGHNLLGVALASRAFNPDDGPLTDMEVEKGERVALMNLMTGALGSYKNPSSHRRVEITKDDARDMLMLASHLLKIVDSREQVGLNKQSNI